MAGEPWTYCDVAPGDPLHGPYHDDEYGFPIHDDARLFERLDDPSQEPHRVGPVDETVVV